MKYEYFDAHSHLNLNQFRSDRDSVARKCAELSVATNTVGIDYETSKLAVELADKHDNLYATVGIHPIDVTDGSFDAEAFAELAKNPKVIAIGETGFDFFRCPPEQKEAQEKAFRTQIELAVEIGKPMMLHIRPSQGTMDAYWECIEILKEYKQKYGDKLRAQAHFFAGDRAVAEALLELDFFISFTGVITFADTYDEIIANYPIDRILSETDAPFVSPVPYRGQRAEPWHVIKVVEKLAEIRGESEESIKKAMIENTKSFFDIG